MADGYAVKAEGKGKWEQTFATTLDQSGRCPCMGEGSVVALNTRADANLVRSRRLGNRNLLLGKNGFPALIDLSGMCEI